VAAAAKKRPPRKPHLAIHPRLQSMRVVLQKETEIPSAISDRGLRLAEMEAPIERRCAKSPKKTEFTPDIPIHHPPQKRAGPPGIILDKGLVCHYIVSPSGRRRRSQIRNRHILINPGGEKA